jgi:hypothetical protein
MLSVNYEKLKNKRVEDTREVIKNSQSVEGQTLQWSNEKEQLMIYKTLHRILKIE